MPTEEVSIGDRARLSKRIEAVDPLAGDVKLHEAVREVPTIKDLLGLHTRVQHVIILLPGMHN